MVLTNVAILTLATIIALSTVQSAGAQQFEIKKIEEVVSAAQNACLAGKEVKGKAEIGFKAALDRIATAISATITGEGEYREVIGAASDMEDRWRAMENKEIRSCTKEMIDTFSALIEQFSPDRPTIVLMDSDEISYEKDSGIGEKSNRVVLREGLAGHLGEPDAGLVEYGIYAGWDRPADIARLKPDLIVLHWSAFEKPASHSSSSAVLVCDPLEDNRCSQKIMDTLRLIDGDSGTTKFIIYSRSKWICGNQFRNGLRMRLGVHNEAFAGKIALISLHSDHDREGYWGSNAISDLRGLARHLLGRTPTTFVHDPSKGVCLLHER